MDFPKPSQGSFELAPAGPHKAICYQVIDLGTQVKTFKGETKHMHQLRLMWELADAKMADGKPFSVGKTYTLSFHEKANLRKDLESWRGKPFDDEVDLGPGGKFNSSKLLGVGCLINIEHDEAQNGKTYANVIALMPLMKDQKVGKPVNDLVELELKPDKFDGAAFSKLSDYWKGVIEKSPEYRACNHGGPAVEETLDDEIPF